MRIVVAGSSGFIGRHLVPALRTAGHEVATLVRRPLARDDEFAWEPDSGVLPAGALSGADVVINLSGAGIGDRRWTPKRRQRLRSSRLRPTQLLAGACARQRIPVLLNASAVGYYGDRGAEVVTESTGPGESFLARLCVDWEAATGPAEDGGTRVVLLRSGLVLGPGGGLLPRLALLTRLLAGGRLGDGTQYWPWISIADHVSAVQFLCRSQVRGPVNVTSPNPVTNAQFTAQLGRALRRPAPWVVPPAALRLALGPFAEEILGGQRAMPNALLENGFRFLQPDLSTALAGWVGR